MKKGRVSKFTEKAYKYSKVYKQTSDERGNFNGIIFKCNCNQLFYMTTSKLSYQETQSDITTISCGCVQKQQEECKVLKAKEIFNKKEIKSENYPFWCTYCESYRDKVEQKSKNTYYCENCNFLMSKSVVIGKTFMEMMETWDPTCHNGKYKRLPYFKGNCKKGYTVAGFTYIDADWYPEASKWLWIKVKHYVRTSLSKENLTRLDLEYDRSCKHKSILLHRFVLGIANGNPLVGDHINCKPLDNRFKNLRIASTKDNSRNTLKGKRRKHSKYKGLYCDHKRKGRKWRSQVRLEGKYLTKYSYTEEQAAHMYDMLLRKYRPSEFNRYNFPREGEMSAI